MPFIQAQQQVKQLVIHANPLVCMGTKALFRNCIGISYIGSSSAATWPWLDRFLQAWGRC